MFGDQNRLFCASEVSDEHCTETRTEKVMVRRNEEVDGNLFTEGDISFFRE